MKYFQIYQAKTINRIRQSFLAAMAEMQLNHFPHASQPFLKILLNSKSENADSSFQEESEYYLSLAYLMNHQGSKGYSGCSIKLKRIQTIPTTHWLPNYLLLT